MYTVERLEQLDIPSLKQICRNLGVRGYAGKRKAAIVSMLATNPPCADLAVFNSEAEIAMRANGWKRTRVRADVARLNRALMLARLNDTVTTPSASPTTTTGDDRMHTREMMILAKFKSFNTYKLLDVVQSGEVMKEVDMIELSRLLMTVHGAVSV